MVSEREDEERKRRKFFDGGGGDDGGGGGGGGIGGVGELVGDSLSSLGGKFQPKGVKFDKPAEFFGHIGAIRGVNFDPKTKRLALIGDGEPTLPPVRLDDFKVVLQIVYGHHPGEPSDPTFSLDPADPDNPAGPWLRRAYMPQLLAGTHMGDVMFRADWVLKQYTFGVIADHKGRILGKRVSSVPGCKSYMELVKQNPAAIRQGEVYSRFWILPLEMKLAKNGNTIEFVRATMQVQTRRMEHKNGRLADSPDKSDPCAEKFANTFTLHYDKFAREAPVLEEVREAAKVVAIVKWLKEQGLGVNDFAIDWSKVPRSKEYEVDPVPSLSQSAIVSLWGVGTVTLHLVGGVELAPELIDVPSTAMAKTFDTAVSGALNVPAGTSVGQLRTPQGRQFRFSVLPLTEESRRVMGSRRTTVREGVTYAADEQNRVRGAFDAYGNSAIFEYDDQDLLVGTHFYTSDDWEIHGTARDSNQWEIWLHSPNNDDLLYRFDADGLISDILVNDEVVIQSTWDRTRNSVELRHLKAVREFGIGDLSALSKPSKVQKTVAIEKLAYEKGKLQYVRQQLEDEKPGISEKLSCKFTEDILTLEGSGFGPIRVETKNSNTVVEDGPAGPIKYEFEPDRNLLKRVSCKSGDSLEFLPGVKTSDGLCTVVIRAKQGQATADVSVAGNKIILRDFRGAKTVCTYKDDSLQIESPSGTIRYEYSKEKQLERVIFPDASVLHFDWTDAANVRRLRVWRQAPLKKKAG